MGYAHTHLENLYRPKGQRILLFRRCYAVEKCHGTSSHVTWRGGKLHFAAGGENHAAFVALFDQATLRAGFEAMGHPDITVYGEAYGGTRQGQAWRYGEALRFCAFEVNVAPHWLCVPAAASVSAKLGLDFMPYREVSTDLAELDAERDAPSELARRAGVVGDQPREGVVLHPMIEVVGNDGERILAKHRRGIERETATERLVVVDTSKLVVLTEALAIAEEYVTPNRLEHVLDHLGGNVPMLRMREVIDAMIEDVTREASGEILDSKEARQAIGKATATMFMARKPPR